MSNLPPLPEGEVKSCTGDRWNEVAVEYFTADQMRAFAEEAVRLEREACELIAVSWSDKSYEAEQIAAEIRARSQEGMSDN